MHKRKRAKEPQEDCFPHVYEEKFAARQCICVDRKSERQVDTGCPPGKLSSASPLRLGQIESETAIDMLTVATLCGRRRGSEVLWTVE